MRNIYRTWASWLTVPHLRHWMSDGIACGPMSNTRPCSICANGLPTTGKRASRPHLQQVKSTEAVLCSGTLPKSRTFHVLTRIDYLIRFWFPVVNIPTHVSTFITNEHPEILNIPHRPVTQDTRRASARQPRHAGGRGPAISTLNSSQEHNSSSTEPSARTPLTRTPPCLQSATTETELPGGNQGGS